MAKPWASGSAGLGLDTRQYNSRSTGTDMLWGGLPYLTIPGASLASRVGASLAVAHGVPDLLTFSEKEYEDLAVSYSGGGGGGPADTVAVTVTDKATGQEKVLHVPAGGFRQGQGAATMRYLGNRERQIGRWRAGSIGQFEWLQGGVRKGRESGKLFDTTAWVKDFEARLGQAWQRYLVDRPLRDLGAPGDDYDDGL